MKFNLKNFPIEYPYPCPNVVKWKEGFEKEIRELKRFFQKKRNYAKGSCNGARIDLLEEILGKK